MLSVWKDEPPLQETVLFLFCNSELRLCLFKHEQATQQDLLVLSHVEPPTGKFWLIGFIYTQQIHALGMKNKLQTKKEKLRKFLR